LTAWMSARQGTKSRLTVDGRVYGLVSIVLLLSSVAVLGSPQPIGAAVYRCLDRTGNPVLSNRQSGLHRCHVLIEDSASPPMPSSDPGMTLQGAAPPLPSEMPPNAPHYQPLPPDQPLLPEQPPMTDSQAPSVSAWPARDRDMPSSPPQPHPCIQGLNPLNPLSTPPCVRADQSGGRPAEAAPVPSQ
jgi:hypothetical protein